ncbi:hypothetical protein CYY_004901 [Polysphondylium violaceum]|uniref:FNIP repeat-containing protein n=1 Tax=Polysphondylium violaceum TaxID=133409 RepID=A0A8J4PUE1_9MYCE|nr:hypothetical protein CYY_004901 [Polysphondylium violaceum]
MKFEKWNFEEELRKHDYDRPTQFKCYNNNLSPITLPYDELFWKSNISPKVGQIPLGTKRIFFDYLEAPIPKDVLPESIEAIHFNYLCQDLSLVSFPSKLKYLHIAQDYINIDRNIDIPESVTHLEIVLNQLNVFHWIYSIGWVPKNVTHLKVTIWQGTPMKPIVVPSSLQVLYIEVNNSKIIPDQIMDHVEYYKNEITRHTSNGQSNLKSIRFPKDYNQYSTPNTFPSTLISLDIATLGLNRTIDPLHIPDSVTSLKCKISRIVPGHARLNYLECPVPNVGEVTMVDDNRSITIDSILNMRQEQNEFETINVIEIPQSNQLISLLGMNFVTNKVYFPQSLNIKSLKASLLPSTYPDSLSSIIITHIFTGDPSLIPSFIKDLTIKLDRKEILNYIDPKLINENLKNKYSCQIPNKQDDKK